MTSSWVEEGAVFRWTHLGDARPMRMLVPDGDVVMYDAWWPHLKGWGLGDVVQTKRKNVSYYVVPSRVVLEKGEYLRSEPLSREERDLHRPDLPFCAVRSTTTSWPSATEDLGPWLETSPAAQEAESTTLACPEVYLIPYGPNGGNRRGARIAADDGAVFTARELLSKAAVLQAPLVREASEGIGLYRSGLYSGGVPSYYLWGSQGRLRTKAD